MNSLELHYYLENGSHSMNALVKNRSESELLKLIFEVSNLLDIELEVEFAALKEGGIRDVIKFIKKKKNRQKIDRFLIYFGAILSGVMINVLSENFNKDSELQKLQKEEIKLNIQKTKSELEKDSISKEQEEQIIENIIISINSTHKVKVFKSRYYSNLIKEPKIYQLSVNELDESHNAKSIEKIIDRISFQNYILDNEEQEPITIDNANIEIVSPVFKQANFKWKGIYNGKPISFQLMDTDFRNSVLNKQYSFTSGTNIKCKLEIIKMLNEEGEEVLKEAKVYDVIEVFDGQQIITTKKAKQIKELKNQMKIEFSE